MTTLDDKLLGEKLQYYYSSSEDEDDHKDKDRGGGAPAGGPVPADAKLAGEGFSINTGPKGVINDWRRFKQLETEQREEQCQEVEKLIKKLSMTCRSQLDEEKEQRKQKDLQEKISGKITLKEMAMMNGEKDDEEFLQQYRKQRMEEMRRRLHKGPQFRQVFEIPSGERFVDMIDKERKSTLIIVHIYEDGIPGTDAMHGCMICLASEYPAVKFCRVKSSVIGASRRFTKNALPTLLIYKGGDLVGNFVRVTDQLGEDFFAVDLEAFLQECGLLPAKEVVERTSVRNAATCHSEDSDLEID